MPSANLDSQQGVIATMIGAICQDLEIKDAKLITPPVYREYRGEIVTLYNRTYSQENFVEDKVSYSYRHVLRGLHGDFLTGKMVSCLSGTVYMALADIRTESPSYLKSQMLVLSDTDRRILYIPPGVLNGHLCITEDCLFWYKLTSQYTGPDTQISLRWNDPTLAICWPISNPILSERDATSPHLAELDTSKLLHHRTIAVSGFFNPLHSGHLNLFAEAKQCGHELVVIVNNDAQVALKGSRRFMNSTERAYMVAACRNVDRTIIAIDADRTVNRTLEQLKPYAFANGGDVRTFDQVAELETCRRLGIVVLLGVGGNKTQSSSWLLNNGIHSSNQ